MRLATIFAALLTALVLTACRQEVKLNPLPAGSVVLAFGDSVTHGTGAPAGQDFPTRLASITGWKIVNAGIPGDTAAAAVGRIEEVLQDVKPALVLIELGGTDFLRGRAEADVKEDLRRIIDVVQAHNSIPVLVSVPGFSVFRASVGSLSDAGIYAELAAEEGVALVEDVFAEVLSDPALRADPIHPNADGYARMADGIAASLRAAGMLDRQRARPPRRRKPRGRNSHK